MNFCLKWPKFTFFLWLLGAFAVVSQELVIRDDSLVAVTPRISFDIPFNTLAGHFPVVIRDVPDTSVMIRCQLSIPQTTIGYTQVSFEVVSAFHNSTTQQYNIPYKIENAGRQNFLTCAADLIDIGTNLTSATPSWTVSPAPFIEMCEHEVIIPNINGVRTGDFQLSFSEPLKFQLTVNCSVVNGAQGDLKFPPVTVSTSSQSIQYNYTILSRGPQPYEVSCSAQSINASQYLHLTSVRPQSAVLFKLDQGTAEIAIEPINPISTTEYQILMYTDVDTIFDDVSQCQLHSFATEQSATSYEEYFNQEQCKPDFIGKTQATTVATTTPIPVATTIAATQTPAVNLTTIAATQTPAVNLTTVDATQTPTVNITTVDATQTPAVNITTVDATQTPAVDLTTVDTNLDELNATTEETNDTTTPETTTTPVTASATTLPPLDSGTTGLWLLEPALGSPSSNLLSLTYTRNITSPINEYLLITCCLNSPNPETLRNQAHKVTKLFKVAIDSPANETITPQSGFTTIYNPAFRENAPCQCDLTPELCDPECCCDTDCTDVALSLNSNCKPGRFGGISFPVANYWCNQTGLYGLPDWAPILCVVSETNANLGLYYTDYPTAVSGSGIITTIDSFTSRLSDMDKFSYEAPDETITTASTTASLYQYGSNIRRLDEGVLGLPRQRDGGSCINSYPMRYLMDETSSCSVTMEASLCASDSILSLRNYLQPNRLPGCTADNSLRSTLISNQAVSVTAVYTCVSSYLEYRQGVATNGFCSWDDGISPVPYPQLLNDTCIDSVIAVSYQIEYNNSVITNVIATYTIADIPLMTEIKDNLVESYIYEDIYNITFNSTNGVNNTVMNYTEVVNLTVVNETVPVMWDYSTTAVMKYQVKFLPAGLNGSAVRYSGKPGYNFDTSPYVAALINNSLTATTQAKLPLADSSGLCNENSQTEVTFPYNQAASCQMEVSVDKFQDCDALRADAFATISKFYPVDGVTHVSRFGVPNYDQLSHWVPILRDYVEYRTATISPATTPPVVTTLDLNITTDSSNTSSLLPAVSTPTGVPIPSTQSIGNITSPPPTITQNRCESVPTSASIVYLYADTGRSGGHTIWQMTGAKIIITEADWTITNCGGSGCIQKFPVLFNSEFIQVPATVPAPRTRYELHKAAQCEECIPSWQVDSFLYPVGRNLPDDMRADNIAMLLFILSLFILMFALSKPWWNKHYGIA